MLSLNNLKFLQKSTIISIIRKHHDHKSHVKPMAPGEEAQETSGEGA